MDEFMNKEGGAAENTVPVAGNAAQVQPEPATETSAPVVEPAPVAEPAPSAPAAPVAQPTYTPYVAPQYNPNGSQTKPGVTYNGYAPLITPPSAVTQNKPNKKGRKIFFIILAAVIALSAVAIPMSLAGRGEREEEAPIINENAPQIELNKTPSSDSGSTDIGSGSILTPEQVYEKIADINVAIIVYKNSSVYTEGTGIVMKEDDTGAYTYILTCAHVISDSGTEIVVQLEDGTRYDATIVGYDARTDIGVLRIKAAGFTVAEFGDSDVLKVGSTVYAIGNPGGSALFGTFTDGKVSAIGRNITSSIGYDMVCIQHNAAISPGNSGGALVNEYGQVIGINSSKIAATEFEGISFAIPMAQAKDVINKIMSYGYVPGRPKLGISYVANDSSSISGVYSMAVQMKGLPSGSLVIYSIDPTSSLADTQAQPGDMIIAVNGKDLDTADVLLETIENSSVGDVIELTIFRIESVGGKYETQEFKVKAKLIEDKNNPAVEETTTRGVYGNNDGFGNDFGF